MTSLEASTASEPANATIVYDGDCIFCNNYAKLVNLRKTVGPVDMVDARSDSPLVKKLWRDGYDLNAGMAFLYQGRVHHGADAVNVLAGLSTTSSTFNRLNRAIFSSAWASHVLYPLLKLGRRMTLLVRGKGMLAKPD